MSMSVITVKKENISLEIIFWRCLWCRFVYDRNEFPPQVFGKIVITGDIPIPYFSLVDNYNGDGFQDLYFEIDIWTTTYHPVKKVTYLVFLKSCYMDVFLRFSQFPKTVFVRICWCCLSSCDDVDRWGKLGNKACEVESLLSIGKEDGLRQATCPPQQFLSARKVLSRKKWGKVLLKRPQKSAHSKKCWKGGWVTCPFSQYMSAQSFKFRYVCFIHMSYVL